MFRTPSAVPQSTEIQKLIGTNDLLTKNALLENLRNLAIYTDEIGKEVGEMVRLGEIFSSEENRSRFKKLYETLLPNHRQEIIGRGEKIAQIEDEIQLYFAQEHRLCFCEVCKAYIGPATAALPEQCKVCGTKVVKSIGKAVSVRYLDSDVRNYLQGIWLQDYVSKILIMMGWETHVECEVMGSSGVYHSVDVLGIHVEKGRVLIAECKRSAMGEHAFTLAARFADIQPSFGLLVSLNKLKSGMGKSLLEKKPGLKLLEIGNLTDQQVKAAFDDYISRDN